MDVGGGEGRAEWLSGECSLPTQIGERARAKDFAGPLCRIMIKAISASPFLVGARLTGVEAGGRAILRLQAWVTDVAEK
jgi:hypothetical protein